MSIEPSAIDELHCPGCGYNLFGIDSEKCPECGVAVDRTASGTSQIPWTHRKSIGWIRAFFKTAFLASFRPKKLAGEMNRPVSYADARKFRQICVILAWLATAAGGIALAYENDWLGKYSPAGTIEQIIGVPLTAASIGIFFLVITGFPSFFFHPPQLSIPRQNRAIALSYYSASAPWLGLWIWGIVGAVTLPFAGGDHSIGSDYPVPIGVLIYIGLVFVYLVPVVMLLILIVVPTRLLGHATHCGVGRQIALGMAAPVAWITAFALIIVSIPLSFFYLAVIFFSMRLAWIR